MRGMGQAGRSDRALEIAVLSREAATVTGATVVHGSVVGEHLSEWAPAGLHLWGVSELVEIGVCAVSPARPGRARLKTVPRGCARLVPMAAAESVSARAR
jgi:hypothetical protein